MIVFPGPEPAVKLLPDKKRLFIGAYGFEDRSLGWLQFQLGSGNILDDALMIKYRNPKGENRIKEGQDALSKLCGLTPENIQYDVNSPFIIEDLLLRKVRGLLSSIDEVIIDISAMTKLLILASLFQFKDFKGDLRLVYCESEEYAPKREEYDKWINDMRIMERFPSTGVESIIRLKCLSSIRMQGQPVTMIAFTSFNEQLVRHMLGTISPHRLIFINGRQARDSFSWREKATQEIHKRLIEEYPADNKLNDSGLLERSASTLDYRETIEQITQIYNQFGTHERIICAATGSKMQTVGLFFAKVKYPDIHVEYPTPDSYFVKDYSQGVRKVHEVCIPKFANFIRDVGQSQFCLDMDPVA